MSKKLLKNKWHIKNVLNTEIKIVFKGQLGNIIDFHYAVIIDCKWFSDYNRKYFLKKGKTK